MSWKQRHLEAHGVALNQRAPLEPWELPLFHLLYPSSYQVCPLGCLKYLANQPFPCVATVVQGLVTSQWMSPVWPWLILSLQSRLPSIHPPHCWQKRSCHWSDHVTLEFKILWWLTFCKAFPDLAPVFCSNLNSILSLHIMFQQYWIPWTSSKKSLSLLYLPDSSLGAPLSCSANQSINQNTWLTRRAVP